MTPKVSLRGVTKSFGTNTVLRNLSLDVANGEVVSLIGASGSGKTTLLRCVNLLEQIDDGAVLLDGDEISAIGLDPNPVRRRVGIVFQSFNLFPHMSVARNITLALTKVLGQSRADAAAQAGEGGRGRRPRAGGDRQEPRDRQRVDADGALLHRCHGTRGPAAADAHRVCYGL